MKYLLWICIFLFSSQALFSQDLLKERIRKLGGKKTSVYVENGIFHNGGVKNEGVLKGIRQSYSAKLGFERIVIDFNSSEIPKIYGNINSLEKRVYIDFFDTTLDKELKTVSSTKFVEKVHFYPIEKGHLSMEMRLKSKASADIFFLQNPGRLVIDLKN
jgi:hypothetical protein